MSTKDMFETLESISKDAARKKRGNVKVKIKENLNGVLTSQSGVKYHVGPRKKD